MMAYQYTNKKHNYINTKHKEEYNKSDYATRRKSSEMVHSTMKDSIYEKNKQIKKESKRPEIQIYRPGMGLWNKNNQKSELNTSPQNETIKYNHNDTKASVGLQINNIDSRSENFEESDILDLEKISPENDNSRKMKPRRPDREVYIPKPRVAALQENGKLRETKTLVITPKKIDSKQSDNNYMKQSNESSPVSKRYSKTSHQRKRTISTGSNNTQLSPQDNFKIESKVFMKSSKCSSSDMNDKSKTDFSTTNCDNSEDKALNNLRNIKNLNVHPKKYLTKNILNKDEYGCEDTDESSEMQDFTIDKRSKNTRLRGRGQNIYKTERHSLPNSYTNHNYKKDRCSLPTNYTNHNMQEDDWETELIPIENLSLSAKTFSQEDFNLCNNNVKDLSSEEKNMGTGSNVSDLSDMGEHSEPSSRTKIIKTKQFNRSPNSKVSPKEKERLHKISHNTKYVISDNTIKQNFEKDTEDYSPKIKDWSEEVEASEQKLQSFSENIQNSKSDSYNKEKQESVKNNKIRLAENRLSKNDIKHNLIDYNCSLQVCKSTNEKEIPPRFQKLNKITKLDNSIDKNIEDTKSGGILRIPIPDEPPQLILPERRYNASVEQACVVQKQLFDPNNPDKPVIIMKQQPLIYPTQNSNVDPYVMGGQFAIIPSQDQFGCADITSIPSSAQQLSPGFAFPIIPPFSTSVPCYNDQLLPENQTRRIKSLTKKNLQDIQLLERELITHLSQGIKNADMKAVGQCRWKLQLRYENIILADPRYCAEQNVEQLLWKSVFYQVIEAFRRQMDEQQDLKEETKKILINTVDEGTVFYENLLEKQQETFGFSLSNYLDNAGRPQRIPDSIRLVLISVQKIIINLGDLARYREQANGTSNYGKARSWYLQAQRLAPKNGRPYNQLAILAVYTRRKLDAVYYYMRSLAASNPFLSARESLLSLFEDARKKYEQVEKKQLEEKLIQREEREKLKQEMEERHEIWIHPDGSSSKRMSKTETELAQDDPSQMATFDLNKRFVISYLHVHGKLFTKIGMETFKQTASNMLIEFRNLLQRTPSPMGPLRLLQLLVINMFAIANTSLKDQSLEPQCRSVLQELALQLSLTMVTLLLERTISLFKEHLASDEYPANLISEDLSSLLPVIKIWTDWMSCQQHLWYPPPSPSDFKIIGKDDVWTAFANLLTVLRPIDISDIEIISDGSREGYELVTLPEDTTLAGFVPLLEAPEDSFYAKTPFDQERARNCLRISRIQFFGDYLCGIPTPYLEFDVENKMFVSLVSSLSNENTESGQGVCYELSDDDVTEDIFDEDDSMEGKSSGTKEQEDSDIQKLWSRKEALKKTKAQQDRYHAKVQAVLQEHRYKRPTVLEVRPRYLIPDTNCFIDHLDRIKSLVGSTLFVLVVPIVVINELDGLARGTRESLYISAEHVRKVAQLSRDAIQFLEERFVSRDSRVQAITSKGSILDTITFRSEDVSDSKGTNDDLILSCCLHYCTDRDFICREEDGPSVLQREAILLTEDRNLRVKALAHNVPVRDLPEFLKWANIR